MVFTGTFWKTFGPRHFVKRNGCLALKSCNPWSKICQKPAWNHSPLNFRLFLQRTSPPSSTRRTLPQPYSKELTGNIPRLFRKKKELGKAGFRVIVFEPFTQHRGWAQIWRVTNGEMWNPQVYILLPLCWWVRPDSWCFKNHFLLASN